MFLAGDRHDDSRGSSAECDHLQCDLVGCRSCQVWRPRAVSRGNYECEQQRAKIWMNRCELHGQIITKMSLTGILPNAVTFQMIMEVFKLIEFAMLLIPPQDLAKFGGSTESQRVLGALQLLQVLSALTSLFRIGEVRVQRLGSPAMTRSSTTSWTCQVQTCMNPFLTPCLQMP